ncbi:facilitated trehalose transporter Tret1 [Anabrus simplex]|uniref:facilitated trehalose transporter Tret1 n=1 Tax=Anabrus simplex TaxID=316456 RepID=UPI0035A2C046
MLEMHTRRHSDILRTEKAVDAQAQTQRYTQDEACCKCTRADTAIYSGRSMLEIRTHRHSNNSGRSMLEKHTRRRSDVLRKEHAGNAHAQTQRCQNFLSSYILFTMEKGSLRMQFIAAGSVTMVYFICGTFAGWPSPTIARLTSGDDEPYLTSDEASWVVSIINITQVITCVPAGYLANIIGRKSIILISTLPFLLSWILVIVAESAGVLYAARIVGGLGLGLTNTVTPMYLVEIAEDRVRGALTTVFMIMMNSGLLFEQCVGPYVSKALLGILSAIFPVIFAVTFIWMPESPYYYLVRNKKEEAVKSLMRLRCVQDPALIEEELHKMELFVEENKRNEAGVKDLFTHRGNQKALFIVTGLFIFQNLCGIIAIVSYSTIIFKETTFAFLTCGTFTGWPSSSCPKLMAKDSPFPVSSDQCSWIIAFLAFGNICGPIPTGYLANVLGRKTVLALSSVPFVVSWLIVTLAQSVEQLYAARFIAGVGYGIAFTVGPMYISEVTENRIRGSMVTLFQVMFNLGTLFEYSVGPYIPYGTLALSSAVFPLIFLVTFVWMPESPYHLLAKDRKEAAERCLMKLRGKRKPEGVKEELHMMLMTVEIQRHDQGSVLDLARSRGNRRAFFIVIALIAIQNFSGIQPILSYTSSIFASSGSGIDANMSAIIFGVVNVLVSVASAALVDRAGRRPLLLVSCAGSSACMLGLGVYFYFAHIIENSDYLDWIPLALVLIYIVMYMIGLGPLPWAVAGEIFPNNVKGYAISFVSVFNALLSLVTVKLFQVLTDAVGEYVVFWIFAICCALGTAVVFIFLPETKGKSLLEIHKEMNKIKSERRDNTGSSNSTIISTCPEEV